MGMWVRVANVVLQPLVASLQQMHGGLHVGKSNFLNMLPSCNYCVYTNVEVWPIPQDPDPRRTGCQTKHEA